MGLPSCSAHSRRLTVEHRWAAADGVLVNHDREVDLQARLEVLEVVINALVLSHRDAEFSVDPMQLMFMGKLGELARSRSQ